MNQTEINNVVATSSLETPMDLPAILKAFKTAEYNPKRFPGLVFRVKKPKTATLIFTSGKIVITGAKKEDQVDLAAEKVRAELTDYDLLF